MGKKAALARINAAAEAYGKDPHRLERELKKLIKAGQESGDALLIGEAYRRIAILNNDLGKRDEALANALKAVAMLEGTDEYDLIANAYIMLGSGYFSNENFQMALVNYDKAYQIIRKHRIQGISRIYAMNNIAICYQMMGDFRMGILLLSECLEQVKTYTPDNRTGIAVHTVNLADCYTELGEYQKAEETLSTIAEWIDGVKFKALVCDYYLRRAILAYQLGKAEEGGALTDTALGVVDEATDVYALYEDLRGVTHILVRGGDLARAKRIVDLMSGFAEKNEHTMDQLTAYRTLADYYRVIGEYARAADYYEKLDALYDKRLTELKSIQLNIHNKIRGADAEIQKLNRKIRESEELVSLEPLTKLLNRTALLRVASDFIECAVKRDERVGAIFIDIDFFKECNDTYGHAKGDEIIKEVARACREEETENVRFARYGGDEFFGIAHGLKDAEVAEVARRICARVRALDIPNEKNPNGHRVTLSVGVVNVVMTERTNTIIDIANYADKAVYHAKNTGKNAIYLLDYARRDEEDKDAVFVKIDF